MMLEQSGLGSAVTRAGELSARPERWIAQLPGLRLPYPARRRDALGTVSKTFGVDAAAQILICVRLRLVACALAVIAAVLVSAHMPVLYAIIAILEAAAAASAYRAHRHRKSSGIPCPRRSQLARRIRRARPTTGSTPP